MVSLINKITPTYTITRIISILLFYNFCYSQSQNWVNKNIFEQKVFIENKGQFDGKINSLEKILYGTTVQGLEIYFTNTGIIYRHNKMVPMTEREMEQLEGKNKSDKKKKEEARLKTVPEFIKMEWLGASTQTTIIAVDPVNHYYTYGGGNDKLHLTSFKAAAFKKIIYRNIYPNIDIEYIIPKDSGGIKYNLLLHPGADLSVILMKYDDEKNIKLDRDGNAIIKSKFGDFIDHAPKTYTENGGLLFSSFSLNKSILSFNISTNKKLKNINQKLTIDPWITTPVFTNLSSPFEIEYDLQGNVYVYGNANPYGMAKLDNTGALIWTYNNISPFGYADFTVDQVSESCYILDGGPTVTGARVYKLNSSGTLIGTSPADTNMNEMHRACYNRCINKIVIGGGGTSSHYQGAMLDTTMSTLDIVDIMNTTEPTHDIVLLAIDNTSNYCYMLPAMASGGASYNNYLFKCPIPSLYPPVFSIPTNHAFAEVSSNAYIGAGANGYNGIAISPKAVYTYDNGTVKKWDKNTGAAISSKYINGVYYGGAFNGVQVNYGGMDADECDNLYVAYKDSIRVYDTNFNLIAGYKLPNNIYDLKLGLKNKLYVCGKQFVAEFNIPPISNPLVTSQTPACGSCNGTASVKPTCGGDPSSFTYSWNINPIQTTATATGLCAGTYSVTLSTSCYIKYDTTVIVLSGSPINITTSNTGASCSNNDGTATVSPTGGTSVYSYSWSNGQTTSTATGLSEGTYTITTADANGCTQTQTVQIKQPVDIILDLDSIVPSCGTNTGNATANPSGGNTPYTYSWSAGNQTTQTATGLAAGTYTVKTTDVNGCTKTKTIKLTGELGLTAGSFPTPCTSNSGIAYATPSNGSQPYTYSWSGTTQTSSYASNLAAGTYTVTVKDASGCSGTKTVEVSQTSNININISSINTSCSSTIGSAAASASAGTSPYTYSWSNLATTASISNLSANTYTVTVTDAQQCTKTATVVISQNGNTIAFSATSTSAKCSNSNDGTAAASVTSGSSPYTYSWSGGVTQTTSNVTGLSPGTYTVQVTDQGNCTLTKTVVITAGIAITFNANSISASCGINNGSISTTASGGNSPYTYSWSGGVTSTTSSASNLSAGTYSITITDANSCTQSVSATINNSGGGNASLLSLSNISCNGLTNGSASVTVSGGATPYSYSWSGITNPTASASNLGAALYTITVVDGNNCQSTVTIQITEPTAIIFTPGTITDANCGASDGAANITVAGGNSPYSYLWNNNQTNTNITGVSSGSYTLTINDASNCTKTTSVTINNIGGANLTVLSSNPVQCYGGNDGSGSVSVTSGGTTPYTYSWSGVTNSTTSASGLSAGNYTVTVKDVNNCQSTILITITQPTAITAPISSTNAACDGINDGTATVTASGGNGSSYSYSWSDSGGSETTALVDSLSPATYTVTITDSKNCTKTATVLVGINGGPIAYAGSDSTIAPGTSIQLNGSGGGTYIWTPPTGLSCTTCQSPVAAPTIDTWYVVTVTDINGCKDKDSLFITIETPCGDIFVPTAFSPNDDGVNDVFKVRGKCMKEFLLQVYNRWGELVFESTDITKGWDGYFRGKPESTSVFVFVLTGNTTKGDEINKKGNVTLVR